LLERGRGVAGSGLGEKLGFGPYLIDPIGFTDRPFRRNRGGSLGDDDLAAVDPLRIDGRNPEVQIQPHRFRG